MSVLPRAWRLGARAGEDRELGPLLGMETSQRTSSKENVMILALPLAMLGAAFLTYVRLATR